MPQSNLAAIRPYLPPDSVTLWTDRGRALTDISHDLCRIVAFLQTHQHGDAMERFHDWWEHDALHFPQGSIDVAEVFRVVGTPRSLIESMPGEHRVFIAVSPKSRSWYLRFLAYWDDDDSNLLGEYSIALAEPLSTEFAEQAASNLKCPVAHGETIAYFRRIEA